MLRIEFDGKSGAYCDRVTRRHALQVGGAGLLGLSLPSLLRAEAQSAGSRTGPGKAKSCILLFLQGGPSHIDMWDLKPQAPREIRGEFAPIDTNVPGIQISEHCPNCAQVADKFTIVRGHTSELSGHKTGYFYYMTGYQPNFKPGQAGQIPHNSVYPSIGSKVARELGGTGPVPAYVNLPSAMDAGGPGFYGAKYGPFVIDGDPVQPGFKVKDLQRPEILEQQRIERRNRLRLGIGRRAKQDDDGYAGTMSTYYEQAYDLITSPKAQQAFDIHREPDSLRQRYGYSTLGQSALLGRRLVEAGCRFVGVDNPGWDVHRDCFPSLGEDLIPQADRAFSALISDLDDRGLLESTLVVMVGEMGRTPRVNKHAGRDHWGAAQSVLFAGGGIRPGQVIGATDKHAARPVDTPVSVQDLHETIFTLLGIDTGKEYHTPQGRPVPIVKDGRFIPGLV